MERPNPEPSAEARLQVGGLARWALSQGSMEMPGSGCCLEVQEGLGKGGAQRSPWKATDPKLQPEKESRLCQEAGGAAVRCRWHGNDCATCGRAKSEKLNKVCKCHCRILSVRL